MLESTQCQGYAFCEGQEEPFAERSNKGNEYAPKNNPKEATKTRKETAKTTQNNPKRICNNPTVDVRQTNAEISNRNGMNGKQPAERRRAKRKRHRK